MDSGSRWNRQKRRPPGHHQHTKRDQNGAELGQQQPRKKSPYSRLPATVNFTAHWAQKIHIFHVTRGTVSTRTGPAVAWEETLAVSLLQRIPTQRIKAELPTPGGGTGTTGGIRHSARSGHRGNTEEPGSQLHTQGRAELREQGVRPWAGRCRAGKAVQPLGMTTGWHLRPTACVLLLLSSPGKPCECSPETHIRERGGH